MSRLDFLYRTELPHRAVAVYIYLADRVNENGECWPAIPTVAADLKYSQSTVRRGIRDLKKSRAPRNRAALPQKRRQKQFAVQNTQRINEKMYSFRQGATAPNW